jgi:hypothetical protein
MNIVKLIAACAAACMVVSAAEAKDLTLAERIEVLKTQALFEYDAANQLGVPTFFYLRAHHAHAVARAFEVGGIEAAYKAAQQCVATKECAPVVSVSYWQASEQLAVCEMNIPCVGVQPATVAERDMEDPLLGFVVIVTGYPKPEHKLLYEPIYWHCCL